MAKHPKTNAVRMLTREYLGASPVNKKLNSTAEGVVKHVGRAAKRGLMSLSNPDTKLGKKIRAGGALVQKAVKESSAKRAEIAKFKIARAHPSKEDAKRRSKLENVAEAQKRGKQSIKAREANKNNPLLGQKPGGGGGGPNYQSRDERWLRNQHGDRRAAWEE